MSNESPWLQLIQLKALHTYSLSSGFEDVTVRNEGLVL